VKSAEVSRYYSAGARSVTPIPSKDAGNKPDQDLKLTAPQLVGWGGFKGPPKDGVVEVGYEKE
jgi:hypothetical protein